MDYYLNSNKLTFNNIWYVDTRNNNGSNSYIGTKIFPFKTMTYAISKCSSGDAIILYGPAIEDFDFTGKNISVIGDYLNTGSYMNGGCHGSSALYSTISFYGLSICGVGIPNGSWSEQFYYINATLYNCIYKDTSSVSCVYGTYSFNNCLILGMANPYSGGNFTNCAFAGAIIPTAVTCLGNVTYDSNYKITSNGWANSGTGINLDGSKVSIGPYGGLYSILGFLTLFLLQDKNNIIYTFNGTLIIQSPSQILNDTNFKINGFVNYVGLNNQLINNSMKLLYWTDDLTKTNCNLIYNTNTYRPIDKTTDNFQVLMYEN